MGNQMFYVHWADEVNDKEYKKRSKIKTETWLMVQAVKRMAEPEKEL